MAKLWAPLFSHTARGPLGDLLEFMRTPAGPSVRKKAIPTGPVTLAQQYQRWDYQFWLTFWQALTPAQKAAQEKLGTDHHMPGLAWFMKTQLTSLPGLLARYHLDEPSGTVARDSSSLKLNATITATSSLPAAIDNGRLLSAAAAQIVSPYSNLLIPSANNFTLSLFNKPSAWAGETNLLRVERSQGGSWGIYFHLLATGKYQIALGTGATGWAQKVSATSASTNMRHLAVTFNSAQVTFYFDAIPEGPYNLPATIAWGTPRIRLGPISPPYTDTSLLDEFSWWDIVLTQAQIKLLAERKWPL